MQLTWFASDLGLKCIKITASKRWFRIHKKKSRGRESRLTPDKRIFKFPWDIWVLNSDCTALQCSVLCFQNGSQEVYILVFILCTQLASRFLPKNSAQIRFLQQRCPTFFSCGPKLLFTRMAGAKLELQAGRRRPMGLKLGTPLKRPFDHVTSRRHVRKNVSVFFSPSRL